MNRSGGLMSATAADNSNSNMQHHPVRHMPTSYSAHLRFREFQQQQQQQQQQSTGSALANLLTNSIHRQLFTNHPALSLPTQPVQSGGNPIAASNNLAVSRQHYSDQYLRHQHHHYLKATDTDTHTNPAMLLTDISSGSNSYSYNNRAAASLATTATTTAASAAAVAEQQNSFADWWTDYWSRQPFPSGYTQSSITLLACFISTIIFLIVVGNLLVCIAIFTEKSLKPTQNWFIASLAVSDMLLGLVVMPFSLARELMGFWIFGAFWCDIHEAMDVLLTTASINTLCLISLDRYWSITQAVNYLKKRTPRRSAFMIAFVWFFSAAVSLPPLFGWKKQSPTITANNTAAQQQKSTIIATTTTAAATATTTTSTGRPAQVQQDEWMRRKRRHLFQDEEFATPILANQNSDDLIMRLATSDPSAELTTLDPLFPVTTTTTATNSQPASPSSDLTTEYPSCQLSDDVGYVLYSAFGSFFIPCAVMVFTYIKIFLAARSRARRAINKQSRAAGAAAAAANKRAAARRAQQQQQQQHQQQQQQTIAGSGVDLASGQVTGGETQKKVAAISDAIVPAPLAVKGKIVVVERRKSLAANAPQQPVAITSEKPAASLVDEATTQQLNRATYTCSELIKSKKLGESPIPEESQQPRTTSITCGELAAATTTTCTLTTSGAKQASISALNSEQSMPSNCGNDCSVITVMNSSMADVPVIRFNFKQQQQQQQQFQRNGPAATERDAESRKTAALLQAFSQVATGKELLLNELCEGDERDADTEAAKTAGDGDDNDEEEGLVQQMGNTTNETCFMTIEEDSDMFDAQAGRTIMMIAGNASKKRADSLASRGLVMTMQPATTVATTAAAGEQQQQQQQQQSPFICKNSVCRRQHHHHHHHHQQQQQQHHTPPTQVTTRSASSYCGSSLTINDDDIDDDCIVDDELLTDDCNGYSVSCGMDQAVYCPASDATFCAHCYECERERERELEHAASANSHQVPGACIDTTAASCGAKQLAKVTDDGERNRQHAAARYYDSAMAPRHRHISDNSDNRSMTGDDNVSLAEYRSNEESTSSTTGHDVLDATESTHNYNKQQQQPRKSIVFGNQQSVKVKAKTKAVTIVGNDGQAADNQQQVPTGGRKKSVIGFRLSRLGSSAALGTHSGGLLALASSQQQQQQGQAGGGAAGRNLKALRQNFFLKLNQLTAKSAASNNNNNNESKKYRKAGEISPTGKSSAHSSGTSYEPSVDCATTSNVHSADYPLESTLDTDYERANRAEECQQSTSKPAASTQRTTAGQINEGAALESANGNSGKQQQEAGAAGNVAADNSDTTNKTPALSDKSDDRALLLRSNHQTPEIGGKLSAQTGGGQQAAGDGVKGGPMLSVGDSQRVGGRTVSSAGSQVNNHINMMSSTTAGNSGGGGAGGTSGTGRAYLASDNERHKRKLAKARERRATLILGLIMAAFITSWLPFFTFYVMRAVCTVCRDYIPPRFEAVIFWLGYCNSAINPIIYTIFNRDFRKAFRKILFKCL